MTAKRFWILASLAAFGCSELPTPPTVVNAGLYRDSQGVWRDSVNKLFMDTLGIWRDSITSFFDSTAGSWHYSAPFMDMPAAYRQFYRYCANCHSTLGTSFLAPKALKALRLDTWDDITAYGANRLLLAAQGGGMPLSPGPKVPDDVLGRAQAYLASWGDTAQRVILRGFNYWEAENFVRKYCADCHTPAGRNPQQGRAMMFLILDTYDQWHKREDKIKERIDPTYDPSYIMPPDSLPPERKPTDAERLSMMEWISRFSPNTIDGQGMGDSIQTQGIVTEGAVQGLVYDTAYKLINRYCADCHTLGGLNKDQPDAWTYALPLDTYAEWKAAGILDIQYRMDSVLASQLRPPGQIMPRTIFPLQPTAAERQLLLDWIRRGSPNTLTGQ